MSIKVETYRIHCDGLGGECPSWIGGFKSERSAANFSVDQFGWLESNDRKHICEFCAKKTMINRGNN